MSLKGFFTSQKTKVFVGKPDRVLLGWPQQKRVGPVQSLHSENNHYNNRRFLYNSNLEQFERSCLYGMDELNIDSQDTPIVSLFCKDGSYHAFPPNVISNPPEFELPDSLGRDLLSSDGEEITVGTEQLYVASSFRVSATNGYDVSRRMNVYGFCQSLEYLAENIHDAIARRGGCVDSIIEEGEHAATTVVYICLPFLWGVPPELDRLKRGIEKGGGIIHKMYPEWIFQ